MEVYLVGGAVRDELLNHPIRERDWVVVGAAPSDLINRGYKAVGRDFPVFIHPKTGEEYALARTEKKTGHGYTGFKFNADPSVTLEDDLGRRDLTINAIARDSNGLLIDPYDGRKDLENKILRHVSEAFEEDPLRVLRTARFAARYHYLGFTIARKTMRAMRTISDSGELEYLSKDRIWKEILKALSEKSPHIFISVLRECKALTVILPEVDKLFDVPQRADLYSKTVAGFHTLATLERSAQLSDSSKVRFATLVRDVGKGVTPAEVLPNHNGYEVAGLKLVDSLCDRLKTPKHYRELALLVVKNHVNCHRVQQLQPSTLLKLLMEIGARKSTNNLEAFLLCCEADAFGMLEFEDENYTPSRYLREARQVIMDTKASDLVKSGLSNYEIGKEIRLLQTSQLSNFKKQFDA